MNSINTKVKLNTIIYDTIDSNVLIQGSSIKNHLSYETEFFVSFSELNDIINQLQKSNSEICVSEMFKEERLDEYLTQYLFNATSLKNPILSVGQYFTNSAKKQIRYINQATH